MRHGTDLSSSNWLKAAGMSLLWATLSCCGKADGGDAGACRAWRPAEDGSNSTDISVAEFRDGLERQHVAELTWSNGERTNVTMSFRLTADDVEEEPVCGRLRATGGGTLVTQDRVLNESFECEAVYSGSLAGCAWRIPGENLRSVDGVNSLAKWYDLSWSIEATQFSEFHGLIVEGNDESSASTDEATPTPRQRLIGEW